MRVTIIVVPTLGQPTEQVTLEVVSFINMEMEK